MVALILKPHLSLNTEFVKEQLHSHTDATFNFQRIDRRNIIIAPTHGAREGRAEAVGNSEFGGNIGIQRILSDSET